MSVEEIHDDEHERCRVNATGSEDMCMTTECGDGAGDESRGRIANDRAILAVSLYVSGVRSHHVRTSLGRGVKVGMRKTSSAEER